ncbi:MAG TPA: VWA domain-containing protein [Pyrinomonadaceae bacterium]
MLVRVLLCHCLIFSMLFATYAQQPSASPTPGQTRATPEKPPEIDSQDVVRITTNLVQVDVVVTKGDKVVPDLQPADFEIFEDGKPQTITNFSYVSNVPDRATAKLAAVAKSKDQTTAPVPPAKINLHDQRRTIALVVDDLGISWESMHAVKTQIKKFIEELSSNDLVAIIRTGGDVGALQQFTNDKRVLQNALDRLRWNPCSRAGFHVFQPLGSTGPDSALCSQSVMNSTLKSLKFILKGMGLLPGRKSMVLLSDYLPVQDQQPSAYDQTVNAMSDASNSNNSDPEGATTNDSSLPDLGTSYAAQLQSIAEIAIRSSVVIYAVDTRGLQYTGLTAADQVTGNSRQMTTQIAATMRSRSAQLLSGREGSDLIARQTGGFLIRNSNDFGLKKVMEDQQGYYLIGFRPTEETFNRSFHHLKARLKRGGFTVRTRAGFYGFTEEQARPPALSATDAMNKALISPFGAHDVSIRLTTFFIEEPGKGPMLRSFLYFDPHDLTFTDQPDGFHVTNLDIDGMLFGDNGRVIGQTHQSGSVRVLPDAYERTVRDGIVYSFDLPVKLRGGVQFRVAVRDIGSGRIGSAGQFVDIPNLQNGRLAMSGIVVRQENATKPAGSRTADQAGPGPAVRRFHQGENAVFAYVIFNGNQSAQLTAQTRVFHDGKMIFSSDPVPVSVQGQTDLKHLANGGRLQLASDMLPGDYVLQIIVTDSADKQKPRVASQWIDFEVVK